jgi:acyl-CoA synthetase (NDP forming)
MREVDVYKILDKYGIKHPKYRLFKIDEKLVFDIFPCVLKVHSEKIVHKSDVGGVILNIQNQRELNIKKRELLKKLNLDKNDGFVVEEQLKGVELFIGGVDDEIFGKILMFGRGGVFLEIEKDITYIDINSDKTEIKKGIKNTKISKIFPIFRGKKYDIELLIKTIQKFQKFFKKENIKEFDINPLLYTDKGIYCIDGRAKIGEENIKIFQNKKYSLFDNKNIAIVGATDKIEKVGYALAKNSLSSKANIYFVNPKLKTLFNQKVYALKTLPKVDTAVIAIPAKFVLETIKFLSNKKECKNFIVISAGFKESGNRSGELELSQFAKKENLNIVGPNCLGIYNDKQKLNLTFAKSDIYSGNIGLISQSGAVLTAIMDKASYYKIGFSHIISMGNMADFNFSNAIKELNRADNCKVISIYAEGIQYGKEFLKAIRNSKKPILFLKSGKSPQAKKSAFSHTGNIAGNYEMFVSLSKMAGGICIDSMDSLIFKPNYLKNDNIIIVTNAGGPATLLTDLIYSKNRKLLKLDTKTIQKLDKILPETWSKNNPIDIIGDATSERYKDTLEIVKNLSGLIFVIITPQFMTDSKNISNILKNYKNVVPIFLSKKSYGYFDSLEEAIKII